LEVTDGQDARGQLGHVELERGHGAAVIEEDPEIARDCLKSRSVKQKRNAHWIGSLRGAFSFFGEPVAEM
jgi:hypothetical protein